ncbi:MAG: GNAT family N-acetyltransferase [Acidobacteriota bacterium]
MKVEIGGLISTDYERVVELFALLGPRYAADVADPKTRRVFDLYLDDERKVAVAARVDGQLVGILLFEVTPLLAPTLCHARADGMVVDPAFQRRGIGLRLLRAGLRVTAERGATSFLAKASDPAVIDLYRRVPELEERGVYFYYNPRPELVREGPVEKDRPDSGAAAEESFHS